MIRNHAAPFFFRTGLLFFILFLTACAPTVQAPSAPPRDECVILLHGMGRTRYAMASLAATLAENGYHTVNFGYPGTDETIEAIAATDIPCMVEKCLAFQARKIHFVTHSLGGIVVRQYLQNHSLPEGSRVVMLSPPNQGSELVDYLKDLWLYRWKNGPAGQQLGTGFRSVPNTLEPVDAEIGVITGRHSFNPLFSQLIPGPDDGKVSVERARLAEMEDFLVLPATHTFIVWDSTARKQVLYFLENGAFKHR